MSIQISSAEKMPDQIFRSPTRRLLDQGRHKQYIAKPDKSQPGQARTTGTYCSYVLRGFLHFSKFKQRRNFSSRMQLATSSLTFDSHHQEHFRGLRNLLLARHKPCPSQSIHFEYCNNAKTA